MIANFFHLISLCLTPGRFKNLCNATLGAMGLISNCNATLVSTGLISNPSVALAALFLSV